MGSIFDDLLGMGSPSLSPRETKAALETEYRKGLLRGYVKGFNAARDKITAMLEEEGKGQTAQRVRKMELKKK